jgi:tetratricopeptide (TPR) repeat protein
MYAHESLQIRSTVLPLQHPDVAGSKLTLARILLAQGEPEEARPLLEETVVIFEQRLPEDHWRTAWARILLASCRAALEDPGASEALLINNLRSIRERFGDTHFRTKEALQVVGQFYDKWGMPEKAAQYFGAADGQSE